MQKLIPLAVYESARERRSARTSVGWSTGVIYGFLFLLVVSAIPGRIMSKQDPAQHWLMWAPPVAIAIIGTPLVLWFLRAQTGENDGETVLTCPTCGIQPNSTGIRLTGCCSGCGLHFVDASRLEEQVGSYRLSDVKQTADRILRIAFVSICGLGLGAVFLGGLSVVFNTNKTITMISLAGLLLMTFGFVATLCWAQSFWKQFLCGACGKPPQNHNWIITTGRCEHCCTVMLSDSNSRSTSLPGLSREELRRFKSSCGKWCFGFSVAAMTTMVSTNVAVVAGAAPRDSVHEIGMALTVLLGIFALAFAFGLPNVREQTRCPMCRSAMLDSASFALASGHCNRCGTKVLK